MNRQAYKELRRANMARQGEGMALETGTTMETVRKINAAMKARASLDAPSPWRKRRAK